MSNNIQNLTHDTFESIKQTNDFGNEFWYARALANILDYSDYRNFLKVIEKAKKSCQVSNNSTDDHLVDVNEMVLIGSSAERLILNIMLTRYACGGVKLDNIGVK